MWKVVTGSKLNPPLKLFFYSPILANNNLLLKIYCENLVVASLNWHFLFFILFFLSISSIRFFFSSCFFFHHTCIPTLTPFFFFFYLILEHSLALYMIRNRERTSKKYLAYSIIDQRTQAGAKSCLLHCC